MLSIPIPSTQEFRAFFTSIPMRFAQFQDAASQMRDSFWRWAEPYLKIIANYLDNTVTPFFKDIIDFLRTALNFCYDVIQGIRDFCKATWNVMAKIWNFLFPADPVMQVFEKISYKGQTIYIMSSADYQNEALEEYCNSYISKIKRKNSVICASFDSYAMDYCPMQRDNSKKYGYDFSAGSWSEALLNQGTAGYAIANCDVYSQMESPQPYDFFAKKKKLSKSNQKNHYVSLFAHEDLNRFAQTNQMIQMIFLVWGYMGFYLTVLSSAMESVRDFVIDNFAFPIVLLFNYIHKMVDNVHGLVGFLPRITSFMEYAPQPLRDWSNAVVQRVQQIPSPFGVGEDGVSQWVSVIELFVQKTNHVIGPLLPIGYERMQQELGLLSLVAPRLAAIVVTMLQISTMFIVTNIGLAILALAPASVVFGFECLAIAFSTINIIRGLHVGLKMLRNWLSQRTDNSKELVSTVSQVMRARKARSLADGDLPEIAVSVPVTRSMKFTDRLQRDFLEDAADRFLEIGNNPDSMRARYHNGNYGLTLEQHARNFIDKCVCFVLFKMTGRSDAYIAGANAVSECTVNTLRTNDGTKKDDLHDNTRDSLELSSLQRLSKTIAYFLRHHMINPIQIGMRDLLVAMHQSYQSSFFHGNCQQALYINNLHMQQEYSSGSSKKTDSDAKILIISAPLQEAVILKDQLLAIEAAHRVTCKT